VGELNIPTLDDRDFLNKKILVRLDINSPIDPKLGRLLDDSRIRSHIPTLKELLDKGNALVLLSHQGRPGDNDFVGLEEHSKLLSKYLGREVEFVEDVIGPYALRKITDMRGGDVVMLDNVRLVSEELIEATPEQHARSFLVTKLSKVVDSFVNDAFATAHRSQPSLVGFPVVIPSSAGRLMEREVSALAKVFSADLSPKVFVLGGGKVQDSLRIVENLSKKRLADRILTGGLLAELFMVAKGMNLGRENLQILEKFGILSLVPRAKKVLLSGAPIEVPVDFKVEVSGGVSEESSTKLNGVIKDIGPTTEDIYSSFIKDAGLTVLRGPMGIIEDERFRRGSTSLLRACV
jgi:3-phosphoglycerate kinase